jgi:hypothetical protein
MVTLTGTSTGTHPDYNTLIVREWETMRHAFRGEGRIKELGETYLPMPSGYKHHPNQEIGRSMYQAYLARARFPEIVQSAVRGMVGISHSQEWQIVVPPALEYLWENSDGKGLPLEALSKRVTKELLITGRYGLLADAPPNGGDIYLAGYTAEEIINWSEDDDFYALRELVRVRNGNTWTDVIRTRELELVEGRYVQRVYDDGNLIAEYEPRARGGAALQMIPLTIGGAMDLDLTPHAPPLIGVARASIAGYQLNADYRNQLYMSGQETFVLHNVEKPPSAVGAGVVISLQAADGSKDTRAEYVGPSGVGIDAHVTAQDREAQAAVRSGAQLFDNSPRGQESGEARRLRFSAETATLSSIVGASALILERVLKQAAIMAGANPDDVLVKAPDNLLEGKLEAQTLTALVASWTGGAISFETLYENLQRGRIASPERTAEEEAALIDAALPDASEGITA